MQNLEWQASMWYQHRERKPFVSVDLIADAELLPEAVHTNKLVKENVISFDQRHRQLSFRSVNNIRIKLTNNNYTESTNDTDHDVFNII